MLRLAPHNFVEHRRNLSVLAFGVQNADQPRLVRRRRMTHPPFLKHTLGSLEVTRHGQHVRQTRVPSGLTGRKLLQCLDVLAESNDGLLDIADNDEEVIRLDSVPLALRETFPQLVRSDE